MSFILHIPVVISFMLLAAHFLRESQILFVVCALALPFLLLLKKRTITQHTYMAHVFGYMLRGGSPESNTDPYAEGPADGNEWMPKGMPHLMIIVPNKSHLEGLPTTPTDGSPWVMWSETPYVHIMAIMPEHKGR